MKDKKELGREVTNEMGGKWQMKYKRKIEKRSNELNEMGSSKQSGKGINK